MATIKHIIAVGGTPKLEIFVSKDELLKTLIYQDKAFEQVDLKYEEYCLTFLDEGFES